MAKKNIEKDMVTLHAEEQLKENGNVNLNASIALQKAEARRRTLLKTYKEEDLVPMYLSPMYRPYVGNVMRVMINGISIYFKVDGSTQMIPKTFADEITARRMAIDDILTKQNRMSEVSSNAEGSPGELELF